MTTTFTDVVLEVGQTFVAYFEDHFAVHPTYGVPAGVTVVANPRIARPTTIQLGGPNISLWLEARTVGTTTVTVTARYYNGWLGGGGVVSPPSVATFRLSVVPASSPLPFDLGGPFWLVSYYGDLPSA